MRWSRALIQVLLEELHARDAYEEYIDSHRAAVRPAQYPQVVAATLILRHSWNPLDFAEVLNRLKLRVDKHQWTGTGKRHNTHFRIGTKSPRSHS